jgi:hypothetical protein
MATTPVVRAITQGLFIVGRQTSFDVIGTRFSKHVLVQLSLVDPNFAFDPSSIETTSNSSSESAVDGTLIRVTTTLKDAPPHHQLPTGDLTITVTNQQGSTSTPSATVAFSVEFIRIGLES